MRNFRVACLPQVIGFVAVLWLCVGASTRGQQSAVTAQVEIVDRTAASKESSLIRERDASNVVVWLIPLDRAVDVSARPPSRPQPQIAQRNKAFEPHVLVIQVGSMVQFPNKDPFFHNVFSLYNGKRFDLGLYEAGTTKSVRFDRPGISYLFCNIHAEMSAVVVAVESPYFGLSDRSGRVAIPDVPDGRYQLHVWYERSQPEDLKALTRVVAVSESARSLEPIRVPANPNFTLAHKNKYGQEYVPPPTAGYAHP